MSSWLYDERDSERACQAYLWSLPAVSFASWQRGITKGLGARNGQIVSVLLKYSRLHTTALCSPSRAAMLSGRDHHAVGIGRPALSFPPSLAESRQALIQPY